MGEAAQLWVICDTSGSMSEAGKPAVLRSLLSFLGLANELAYNAVSLTREKTVVWNEKPEIFASIPNATDMRFFGRPNMDALLAMLSASIPSDSNVSILFLTDGQWPQDYLQAFQKWFRTQPRVGLAFVAVGCDSNLRQLQGIAGSSAVFLAEEIVAALHAVRSTHRSAGTTTESHDKTIEGGGS